MHAQPYHADTAHLHALFYKPRPLVPDCYTQNQYRQHVSLPHRYQPVGANSRIRLPVYPSHGSADIADLFTARKTWSRASDWSSASVELAVERRAYVGCRLSVRRLLTSHLPSIFLCNPRGTLHSDGMPYTWGRYHRILLYAGRGVDGPRGMDSGVPEGRFRSTRLRQPVLLVSLRTREGGSVMAAPRTCL